MTTPRTEVRRTPTSPPVIESTVWYFIATWECVLCGHTDTYRERRHDPRPEAWADRHEYHETACDGHFM
jgi:hypothetical protein